MESVISEFCLTLYPLPHYPEGWLLGANRDYVKDAATTNYFGFDLGYDKNGVLGSYTPQYNGNISGMLWKSAGDGEKRKYDFDNDTVNRLMNADFGQYDGSAFNAGAGVDFSRHMGNGTDPLTAYDANGNIKAMTQRGNMNFLKPNFWQIVAYIICCWEEFRTGAGLLTCDGSLLRQYP